VVYTRAGQTVTHYVRATGTSALSAWWGRAPGALPPGAFLPGLCCAGRLHGFRQTGVRAGYVFGCGEIFTSLCRVCERAALPLVQPNDEEAPPAGEWAAGPRVASHSRSGRRF